MQGISDTTPQTRFAARLGKRFFALATVAALAGLSLMTAVPVQAAASIVVTVNSDTNKADHTEAVSAQFGIASFTDSNACTGVGVCNLGTDYSVDIGWGDNSTHSTVAAAFVSQSGNTGTYSVTAPHTYLDENNGPVCPPCGFGITVVVTNNINTLTSGSSGTMAVGDQPLAANTGYILSGTAGSPFGGVVGSFHDGNNIASDHEPDPVNGLEFSVTIKWGDGTSNDTSTGSITVGACGSTPGLGAGQGCQIQVNGSHPYAKFGRYLVTVYVNDGANQKTVTISSTANIYAPGELQLTPTGLGFGQRAIGTVSDPQTFTVSNPNSNSIAVTSGLSSGDTTQFHIVDNACSSVTLAPLATCTAHFTFNPTTIGGKQARFTVNAPPFAPLAMVLSGTGVVDACASTAISTNPTSPQPIGTTVTFNATSAGCPDASPLYRFWVRVPNVGWVIVRDYKTDPSFPWVTLGGKPGTYLTGVWVKDAKSTKTYDAYAFGTFTLTGTTVAQSCSSVNFSPPPSLPSPQTPGPTVTFNATALGCSTPNYRFFVESPGGTFVMVQDYPSLTGSYAWHTAGLVPGPYQIGVWARQAGSTVSYQAFAIITFQLVGTPCTTLTVTTSPGLIVSQGPNTIQFTVDPGACPSPTFQFYLRYGTGSFAIVRPYGPSNTYTLALGTAARGSWTVAVAAKDATSSPSPSVYDSFAVTDFTVI